MLSHQHRIIPYGTANDQIKNDYDGVMLNPVEHYCNQVFN